MKTTLMKCGHTAQAIVSKTKEPVCLICHGNPEAAVPVKMLPDLSGRLAKCTMCGRKEKSSIDLPFFEYRGLGSRTSENQCHICGYFTKGKPLKNGKFCYHNSDKPIPNVCINKGKECKYGIFEYDLYYCGCRGWD